MGLYTPSAVLRTGAADLQRGKAASPPPCLSPGGSLGASWGRPGRILGPSWGRLGASWERLGASWARLGASFGRILVLNRF